MTKTVIEMAREAGLERVVCTMPYGASDWVVPDYERLGRFAELVRADEREAIIQEIPGGHRLVCDLIRARNGGAA